MLEDETDDGIKGEEVGADVTYEGVEVVRADVVTWLLAPVVDGEDPDGVYVNGGMDTKEPLMLYAAWHSARLKPCKCVN